ncbi:MAG TPA: SDR family oxidoreductase [Acidimicrobiales bacterium]|jgi:NAD(P)-dependent dehydrogenase (short-subunit alcohol dehydrogenase family)|nr:SDR family oxidoreductase [Acidimicrobiales bacterium]
MPIDDSPVPDYGQLLRLDGRAFAVGGAGFGIGRQVAHALSSQGASVLCIDVIEDRAAAVAAETGGVACVADLRLAPDVERSVDRAERQFGHLNGVVDIVGGARWSSLTEHDWDGTFDENFRHVFLMIKFGAPALKRAGGGSLAFVSSMSGTTTSPFHGAYGAAKAGIVSLVRSAAAELRRDNIRVNSVAPGATATPRMIEATGETSDGTLTGWGAPSDIAAALLFLSSDLARHVSGQTFLVDGATTAEYPQDLPASLTGQP